MTVSTRRLRRIFDVTIVVVALMGVAFYLPKLLHAVGKVARGAAEEGAADPGYAHAFLLLGLLPLVGSLAMLAPCHSFFATPLPPRKRFVLGLLCLAPMGMAVYGSLIAPPPAEGFNVDLARTFLRLGVICSLGVWFFALPAVLRNIGFIDVAAGLLAGFSQPKARRRSQRFSGRR